ncbi:hypothetical protein P691DRAFT_756623 [Macrolepiota fuliginosa MF-IS2]|uniref:SnoaL-like domain-containing protein n=1 Tax=Macrolepiota fuliginosa MF-IS2 TaxID=1400762 RepID=A0A9P5XKN2_9AGAR|nr:hypothetical protein P691DRAFT_756623 [Macrolepiota fuliginosa MF-IS2]
MLLSRQNLIQATQAFCDAFANKADISTILTYFSKTTTIIAFEHGEPALVPFLGRAFEGFEGVKRYFEIIGTLLAYHDLKFSEFIVDTEARKVSVKGEGIFTWLETMESWDETFTYVLDFDEEAKVVRYQVWADTGAAYLASIGKLDDIRKEIRC